MVIPQRTYTQYSNSYSNSYEGQGRNSTGTSIPLQTNRGNFGGPRHFVYHPVPSWRKGTSIFLNAAAEEITRREDATWSKGPRSGRIQMSWSDEALLLKWPFSSPCCAVCKRPVTKRKRSFRRTEGHTFNPGQGPGQATAISAHHLVVSPLAATGLTPKVPLNGLLSPSLSLFRPFLRCIFLQGLMRHTPSPGGSSFLTECCCCCCCCSCMGCHIYVRLWHSRDEICP